MLTSINKINEILTKYEFSTSKTLGQNFLIDANIVNNIIKSADISKDDIIIEIGPGIGSLTEVLIENAYYVYSIEIDKRLYPILEDNFFNKNFTLIKEDFLKLNLKEFLKNINKKNKNIKIVANLPYYISTAIIMKILESNIYIKNMVFMLQKEVAYRIISKKDTKEYGILSVMCQYFSNPEICFKVSKNSFIPKPNVDSAVIKFELKNERKLNYDEFIFFSKIVKESFSKRRKTLVNSLSSQGNFKKEVILNALIKMNLDKNIRAENLNVEEFIDLSFILKNI